MSKGTGIKKRTLNIDQTIIEEISRNPNGIGFNALCRKLKGKVSRRYVHLHLVRLNQKNIVKKKGGGKKGKPVSHHLGIDIQEYMEHRKKLLGSILFMVSQFEKINKNIHNYKRDILLKRIYKEYQKDLWQTVRVQFKLNVDILLENVIRSRINYVYGRVLESDNSFQNIEDKNYQELIEELLVCALKVMKLIYGEKRLSDERISFLNEEVNLLPRGSSSTEMLKELLSKKGYKIFQETSESINEEYGLSEKEAGVLMNSEIEKMVTKGYEIIREIILNRFNRALDYSDEIVKYLKE